MSGFDPLRVLALMVHEPAAWGFVWTLVGVFAALVVAERRDQRRRR